MTAQKVSRAIVWVNNPAGALLLGRRVRRAWHYAELLANESSRPDGEQCLAQGQLNFRIDRSGIARAAPAPWAGAFSNEAGACLGDD